MTKTMESGRLAGPRGQAWPAWAMALVLWLLMGSGPAIGEAGAAGSLPGPLVSVPWLRQQLGQPGLVVVDASPGPMHRQRHIPGAVLSTLFTFGPKDPPVEELERHLRRWGVGEGHRLVIVDPGGTYMATRLYWDLLHRGFPAARLAILDGGMAKWLAEGGAVTAESTPTPAMGNVRLGTALDEHRVRLPEFLAASADPRGHALLEALEPDYFYGGAAYFNRGGHVPHATLMPADDFFNADKTFKSAPEVQRMLDHLGVRRDQQVLTYCGGGGAAAVPWFVLKQLLAYPRVKLFQESQMAWLQDPRELPVWTYAEPYRLRETAWLKAWASPMLVAFGLSTVSVLDVRPADAFRLGHVPLAQNLPADVMAGHRQQPAALAALLAKAGVDPALETVVVSDGGLDERAATAVLLLESLGQRRVSVLLDSLERWAELGQAVARPAAASAAASSATSSATSPANRTAATTSAARDATALRAGLILADPRARSASAFPRVYVAAGALPPARPPEGRLLHLPPSLWLDADGRPRPAKDIWAAFDKAGLPRYAEIVVTADTLGEAARGYVVMRLMGLADVKVWVP